MRKHLPLLFAAALLVPLLWWALRPGSPEAAVPDAEPSEDLWAAPIEEQAAYERRVIPLADAPPRVFAPEGGRRFTLARGMTLLDGDVVVSEFSDMRVHRFDREGRPVAVYGAGTGTEPGQHTHLTDVAAHDGGVLVLDGASGRFLSFFDADGTFRRRFYMNQQLMRVAPIGDRLALMGFGDDLLHHYSPNGRPLFQHGRLVEGQAGYFYSDIGGGDLLQGPDEGMIFAPAYAGYFFYLDRDGAVRRIVRTIDREEFGFREAEGARPERPYARSITMGQSADPEADRIYVTTHHVDEGRRWIRGYLDVYEWGTGAYVESYPLPFWTGDAVRGREGVLVRTDTAVVLLPVRAP